MDAGRCRKCERPDLRSRDVPSEIIFKMGMGKAICKYLGEYPSINQLCSGIQGTVFNQNHMGMGQNNLYIPFPTVAKTHGSEGTQFLGPKSISAGIWKLQPAHTDSWILSFFCCLVTFLHHLSNHLANSSWEWDQLICR